MCGSKRLYERSEMGGSEKLRKIFIHFAAYLNYDNEELIQKIGYFTLLDFSVK